MRSDTKLLRMGRLPGYNGSHALVLAALHFRSEFKPGHPNFGWSRITYKRIAALTGLSQRTVIRCVHWLVRHGIVVRQRTYVTTPNGQKRHAVNRYWLEGTPPPVGSQVTSGVVSQVTEGVGTTGDTTTNRDYLRRDTNTAGNNSDQPTLGLPSPDVPPAPVIGDDLFEQAWAAYPEREGGNSKAAARRQWDARVKAGEDPEVMLAGTKRYAEYCAATNREARFVKMASTFFGRDKHYLEQYETIGPPPGMSATAWEEVNREPIWIN